ncbi:MAG: hypothetical protein ACRD0K_18920 [Egibacteraceae bacterium]
MPIDGTVLDVADTPDNDEAFSRPGDGAYSYNLDTLPVLETLARGLHPELFD